MTTSIRLNCIRSSFLFDFIDSNGFKHYFFCSERPKHKHLFSGSIDVLVANGATLLTFDSTVQIGNETIQVLYDYPSEQWFSYYEFDTLNYFPLHYLLARSRAELIEQLNYAYAKAIQASNIRLETCKQFVAMGRFDKLCSNCIALNEHAPTSKLACFLNQPSH